jgi:hypothetical protein
VREQMLRKRCGYRHDGGARRADRRIDAMERLLKRA